MPLDIALIASTAISIALPYVKAGAQKIAKAASKEFGDAAAKHAAELAEKVWDRIKSVFTSEREKGTIADFEEEPVVTTPLIEKKLQAKLEQDPQLAQELEKLVNSTSPDGKTTGAQIFGAINASILDMRGANLSHAHNMNIAGMMIDQPKIPPAPPLSEPPNKT